MTAGAQCCVAFVDDFGNLIFPHTLSAYMARHYYFMESTCK